MNVLNSPEDRESSARNELLARDRDRMRHQIYRLQVERDELLAALKSLYYITDRFVTLRISGALEIPHELHGHMVRLAERSVTAGEVISALE